MSEMKNECNELSSVTGSVPKDCKCKRCGTWRELDSGQAVREKGKMFVLLGCSKCNGHKMWHTYLPQNTKDNHE